MTWLDILGQGFDILVFMGRYAWGIALSLPKELLLVGLVLSIVFIAYAETEYSLSQSGTGIALEIVIITFIIAVLFIYVGRPI